MNHSKADCPNTDPNSDKNCPVCMNTPQSSEKWRYFRLPNMPFENVFAHSEDGLRYHAEEINFAHEIAEAERRGYESGYDKGFVAGGNIGYKKSYDTKEGDLTN